MIFYKKECTVPALNGKTAQMSLSPYLDGKEGKKSVLYPENCVNFRFKKGALRSGFGAKRVFESNPLEGYDVLSAYLYRGAETGEEFLFYTPNGLYCCSLTPSTEAPAVKRIYSRTFTRPPRSFRYVTSHGAERLMLCDEEGLFEYDGKTIYKWATSWPCSSGCAYYDRLFVVSSETDYRIHFSAPLKEGTWLPTYRTTGYVDLFPEYGAVHALFPCGKGLYALRDRGLTLIRAESENFNFTATPVAATFGAVYPNSVQSVGSRLVFLASDGLYAFDGNGVKRIAERLIAAADLSEGSDLRSCAYGAYYVLNYQTAAGERRTLFLDTETEEGWFSDINFSAPASDGSNCYFSDGGVLATFTEESVRLERPLTKVWESGYTRLNLGTGRKNLRALTVFGKGNFKLTVKDRHACDERVFSLALDGEKTVRPLLKSRGFFLRVESDDKDCVLEGISATVDFLKEEK